MISSYSSRDISKADATAFLIRTLAPYSTTGATAGWSEATTIEATGIDSFDFVEIIFKIEDEYAIDIDFNANLDFAQLKTIGDLAACIVAVLDRAVAA